MSSFEQLANDMCRHAGVEIGTMMGSTCLRYQSDFMAMMFDKEDALIIKVSPKRVIELIEEGLGMEFNYTGKRFKEWVMIPLEFENDYPGYLEEARQYAKRKK